MFDVFGGILLMRYPSTLVVLIGSLVLFQSAQAQNPTESQSFDSEASAREGGWRESGNNRKAEVALDFGFSDTENAGGGQGEAGGQFAHLTSEVAFYGDLSIGEWTLDDPLTASGKFYWDDSNLNTEIMIGFFDGRDIPGPPDHLGAGVGTEFGAQYAVLGLSNEDFRTHVGNLRNASEETPIEFTIEYDPAGGGFAEGLITTTFDGDTSRRTLRPDDRIFGAELNAFGMLNSPRPLSDNLESTAIGFIDDVTYTSNGENGPAFPADDGPIIQPGDANLDRQFDTADIVAVLSANLFEKDEPATWAQGDWNAAPDEAFRYGGDPPAGDGRFNTLDIVAALAANIFESGEVTAAIKGDGTLGNVDLADVPEPSSLVLLTVGLAGLAWRQRKI